MSVKETFRFVTYHLCIRVISSSHYYDIAWQQGWQMADHSSSHTGAYLLGQLWIIPAVYSIKKNVIGCQTISICDRGGPNRYFKPSVCGGLNQDENREIETFNPNNGKILMFSRNMLIYSAS